MPIIGITGGLGSGKSTVAAMFQKRGAKIIDADAITRALIEPGGKCIKKVAKTFPDVILENESINRSQLAKTVFKNPRELKKLTDILYPEALKDVKRQISQYKDVQLIVLDVPLLFEAGWDRITDTTLVVVAKRQQQLERAQKRLKLSQAEAKRRLKFQMPIGQKKALADILVDNSRSILETRKQVDAIVNRLSKRTKS